MTKGLVRMTHSPAARFAPRCLSSAVTCSLLAGSALAQVNPVTPELIRDAEPPPPTAATPSHNPGVPGTIEGMTGLIARLDSESWAEREEAFRELQAHPAATEDRLAELAKNDAFSLEQRRRLAGAVRERFINSPRGAIGIQFAPGTSTEPAIIDEARPNFPAGQLGLLRAGDRIDAVDGIELAPKVDPNVPAVRVRAVFNMDDPARRKLISYVVSRNPGDEITLRIRRPIGPARLDVGNNLNAVAGDAPPPMEFETLEVKVPLGSYDDLHPIPAQRQQVALQAWPNRAAKLGLSDMDPPLITSNVEPEVWNRARPRAQYPPTIAGEARPAGLLPGRVELNRGNQFAQVFKPDPKGGAIQIVAAGQGMVNVIQIAEPGQGKIDTKELTDARQLIVARIDSLQQEIDGLRQQLALPSLRAKERQSVEARLSANEQQMQALMKQNADLLKRQLEQLPKKK